MKVKTGTLRNNLSRYLKRVRQTGETIIVLDRNTPVAELRPIEENTVEKPIGIMAARAKFEAENGPITDDFELPPRRTSPEKYKNPLD